MSTVLDTVSPVAIELVITGVVRGKTIELDRAPGLPEGQRVSVNLSPLRESSRHQGFPREVMSLSKQLHIEDYLNKVYEMTRRMFPLARKVEVFVEDDPEIANQKYIVFQVTVPGLDAAGFLDGERRWVAELFRCCPTTVSSAFTLGLEMAD